LWWGLGSDFPFKTPGSASPSSRSHNVGRCKRQRGAKLRQTKAKVAKVKAKTVKAKTVNSAKSPSTTPLVKVRSHPQQHLW
jgi:hypothetical protein